MLRTSAAQTGFVELDAVRLAWERHGPRRPDRPTLLLAHGLTDSAATWERVARRLAVSYDVVRLDARGHGASDRAPDYSVEANTADLVAVCRALELHRPVLVGHSMGAVHAALAASRIDLSALVLEDPHWPEVAEDGSKDVAASRASVVEVAALPEPERRSRARTEHPDWADVDVEAWAEARRDVDPDVVSWFRSWPTTNRWQDHVAGLTCPGLLVTGNLAPTVTPRAAAEARTRWPRLETVEVAGAGHNVRRDRFEPYLRAVSTFLDRLGPPDGARVSEGRPRSPSGSAASRPSSDRRPRGPA